MIIAIYEVPSPIVGAPRRFVGLDEETGEFGLAQAVAISPGKFTFTGEKMTLSGAIELAGGVLAGDPRKVTDPLALRRLAIAFVAAAAKVGQIAEDLKAAEASDRGASENNCQLLEMIRGLRYCYTVSDLALPPELERLERELEYQVRPRP